jgi:hypothetical protein
MLFIFHGIPEEGGVRAGGGNGERVKIQNTKIVYIQIKSPFSLTQPPPKKQKRAR